MSTRPEASSVSKLKKALAALVVSLSITPGSPAQDSWRLSVLTSPAVTQGESSGLSGWETSEPSTIERDVANLRSLRVLAGEVEIATALLSVPELEQERGFWPYVDRLHSALSAYSRSPRQKQEVLTLARSLVQARSALQEQISTLAHWLIVDRITQPDAARYAQVPARFRRTDAVDAVPSPQLSLDVVDTWLMTGVLPSV